MLAILLAVLLVGSQERFTLPQVPVLPLPWEEHGNRHARRRDRKLGRA